MEEGRYYGMQTFDRALADLVGKKLVTFEDAPAVTARFEAMLRSPARRLADMDARRSASTPTMRTSGLSAL